MSGAVELYQAPEMRQDGQAPAASGLSDSLGDQERPGLVEQSLDEAGTVEPSSFSSGSFARLHPFLYDVNRLAVSSARRR
jgi:hypothetical protein